jgi:UDP-N-acetylmuramoyl-tripeptide--D-alanyl-D-alanine ligase
MMQFTRMEIARAVNGELHGSDGLVVNASIDSRSISEGALFVPIRAERDGHDFIPSALERGAGAHLTEKATEVEGAIVVEDTQVALAELGKYARKRMHGAVVGITGSSGKTSTKDLCGPMLQAKDLAAVSEKSLNNELGVPLTLINAPHGAENGVLELGARGTGHIAYLCEIASPNIAIITNIGTAHRELFKTDEATAHAKGELLEMLPPSGTAVLNRDDRFFELLQGKTSARVLSFSIASVDKADLVAENVTMSPELYPSFDLRSPWGTVPVTLKVRGHHQIANTLAAAGAALAAGASLEHVASGIQQTHASPWRMELTELSSGTLLINDAYNANPSSMKVALDALAALDRERTVAVLGTMAELGDDADAMHLEVMEHARALGISQVLSINEPRYRTALVADFDAAEKWLMIHELIGPNDAILVKGSRVAGLERLAHALVDRFGGTK